jgi:hypothetical protein
MSTSALELLCRALAIIASISVSVCDAIKLCSQ